jgi:phospholipid/cholesterol/gamma-HCH transport system substrate-binding protein
VTLAIGVLGLNTGTIVRSLTQTSYTAEFATAGDLAADDEVWVTGVRVGQVDSVRLDGEHVAVGFSIDSARPLGDATRASVEAATVLGKKVLVLQPAGPGALESGGIIPLARTQPPYDLAQVLSRLTSKSEQLDKERLSAALNTISAEFNQTNTPLRGALDGLNRLSDTIASRDVAVRQLFAHAQAVSAILAKRSDDVVTIVSQGNLLLSELNDRREVIRALIQNVTVLMDDLKGLVDDNESKLGPTLDQLGSVLGLLNRNKENIEATIQGLNIYAGSLGEAVATGPWFFASIQNLAPPTNLVPGLPLQPGPSAPVPGAVGSGVAPEAGERSQRGAGR